MPATLTVADELSFGGHNSAPFCRGPILIVRGASLPVTAAGRICSCSLRLSRALTGARRPFSLGRHARACHGHPRLSGRVPQEDMDAA